MSTYKLADSVSMRLIQIFQEAVMTGVDGADLLRQVELEPDGSDDQQLVMTKGYKDRVRDMHVRLESQALELKERGEQFSTLSVDDVDTN